MISNAITSKIVGHAFQQLPSPKQTQCSCEVTRVSKSISSAMQLTLQETNTFLQNCFFYVKHHQVVTCSTSRITKSLLVLFGLLGTLTVTWYLILAIGISFLVFFLCSIFLFLLLILCFRCTARSGLGRSTGGRSFDIPEH